VDEEDEAVVDEVEVEVAGVEVVELSEREVTSEVLKVIEPKATVVIENLATQVKVGTEQKLVVLEAEGDTQEKKEEAALVTEVAKEVKEGVSEAMIEKKEGKSEQTMAVKAEETMELKEETMAVKAEKTMELKEETMEVKAEETMELKEETMESVKKGTIEATEAVEQTEEIEVPQEGLQEGVKQESRITKNFTLFYSSSKQPHLSPTCLYKPH